MPIELTLTSHTANGVMSHTIAFLRSSWKNKMKHNFFIMWCNWYQHHITPLVASMAHKHWCCNWYLHWHQIHIIPINNHLNMANAKVSLIVPSASYDRKHVIAIYLPKTNICFNCINKPHMAITLSTNYRQLGHYICLKWTQCNWKCDLEHWYTYISCYWHMPLIKYESHLTYICLTALLIWSAFYNSI